MKTTEDFTYLWPVSRRREVRTILDGVEIHVGGPPLKAKISDKSICVLQNQDSNEVLRQLGFGYPHVIQKGREDFGYSLLSTALISKKSETFFQNPFPFLFRSFKNGLTAIKPKELKVIKWTHPWDKASVIDDILKTFSGVAKIRPYREVVALSLDEMLTNARPIDLSESRHQRVLAAFAEDRLCTAVYDFHPNFDLPTIRSRLWDVSRTGQWQPKPGSGGAGLGLPLVIGNSTSFYLCHAQGFGGLAISLIDIRKGLRDLQLIPKNVHLFSC